MSTDREPEISDQDSNYNEIIKQYFTSGSIISSLNNDQNNDEDNDEEYNDNIDNCDDNNSDDNNIIIGIDLGTTNTCVSIWRNNNLEIIPDEYGNGTIPSFVAFTNKSRYLGYDAKNQKELNPKNVFYEVKRLIGRKITDNSVIQDSEFFTFDIVTDDDNNVLLLNEFNKKFTPEEISAMILTKVKIMASDYLKQEINKAVITVPAYFNDSQRQATKDAAAIAGLDCVRIINEPTAAALAYGLLNKSIKNNISNNSYNNSMNVVVYDLGGGTLDVSILNICDGIFEVLSSVGNTHLGGADFDNRLVSYCITEFKKKNGIDKLKNLSVLSMQKLRRECENTKILLSTTVKTNIAVKNFYEDKNLIVTMTRDKYIRICRDLLILCIKPLEDSLNSAKLERSDIDEIILVGGMTRMPIIRENIKNFFSGKEPNCTINPDEVVSTGAAIQAYLLSNKDDPFSENVTLLDIIPLSLGVETINGVMNVLIPRNSVIPISKKKLYTTDTDYCESVIIKIFEGERKMTKDNFFIGEFELADIDPAPRGIPQIEVKFNIDINGIITVVAENKDKNNKKSITITGNKGRLKPEEIKKLINEAKFFELKDKIEKQKKQSYYEIEDLSSNIKINISKSEYKLSDSDKKMILEDINEVLLWLKEKKYYDRDHKEYMTVIDKLKKRYGTLILKGNMLDENVKSSIVQNDRSNSTTVYGNDDDEDESKELFEQIENEEMGINKLSENEKLEIKQLRNCLIELCNSVHEIVTSSEFNFEEEHKRELRDYIDDILLWVHVHQNPTKIDYKSRIDEVNDSCNKMIEEYEKNNKSIFEENVINKNINTKKDELEQLCIAIKSSIECNVFSLEEENMKKLDDKVSSILDWIIETENCEEEIYIEKLNEINLLCDNLYHSMIGISMHKEKTILGSERDDIINMDFTSGTDLSDIINKN